MREAVQARAGEAQRAAEERVVAAQQERDDCGDRADRRAGEAGSHARGAGHDAVQAREAAEPARPDQSSFRVLPGRLRAG